MFKSLGNGLIDVPTYTVRVVVCVIVYAYIETFLP